MTVYLQDTDLTLHHGDCLEVLRTLPDRSVHMCATSPPFYGLRDYGTGEWEGGNPDCDHKAPSRFDYAVSDKQFSNTGSEQHATFRSLCGKCGARRVDQQIGLEETPDQWVERLVAVFREVRRVLRDDGTLWVEIGDSYCSQGGDGRAGKEYTGQPTVDQASKDARVRAGNGVKPKDLLGQPWLLAFALRVDGWYLRSEIIWARPNPMPESVTDRPTKAHSTVFLLSKLPRYYFDQDAIREAFSPTNDRGDRIGFRGGDSYTGGRSFNNSGQRVVASGNSADLAAAFDDALVAIGHLTLDGSDGESPRGPDGRRVTAVKGQENSEQHRDGERWPNPAGANARSVWQIPTEPTPFAHFATWPRKLVARMILAGTSERGCCPECGAPWVRDVEREFVKTRGNAHPGKRDPNGYARSTDDDSFGAYGRYDTTTVGWSPSCQCSEPGSQITTTQAPDSSDKGGPVPCTVLDPFAGSGTTLLVARQHGRHSIGIELNQSYCELVRDRTSQQSLLADAQ